jgi:hypothetical protein
LTEANDDVTDTIFDLLILCHIIKIPHPWGFVKSIRLDYRLRKSASSAVSHRSWMAMGWPET